MALADVVDGMIELVDRFEGFVLDQWGVLHDGTEAYEGVHEALAELQRRNKRVVLLSNASRRLADNEAQLRRIGFNPGMFEGIVTSGETAHRILKRGLPPFDGLGRRCLLLSYPGDEGPVEGLGLDLVDEVEGADFLFMAWFDGSGRPEGWFERMAERGVERGLTMICSNPDRLVRVQGGLIRAPGYWADLYRQAGGRVVYVGKPHRPVYDACLEHLEGLNNDEILCVGDSLEHDIKGANDAGLASLFVLGGIHGDEAIRADGLIDRTAVTELALQHGAKPNYVAKTFKL